MVQHADQKALQSPKQSADLKVLQNKITPLLERFIPVAESHNCMDSQKARPEVVQHTDQAALQNANQEALQKDVASLCERGGERNMTEVEGLLGQSGLSNDQIENFKKLCQDALYKLKEKFFKLPFEQLQSLFSIMKRQEELGEKIVETRNQWKIF